jgi:hypothetical protein
VPILELCVCASVPYSRISGVIFCWWYTKEDKMNRKTSREVEIK